MITMSAKLKKIPMQPVLRHRLPVRVRGQTLRPASKRHRAWERLSLHAKEACLDRTAEKTTNAFVKFQSFDCQVHVQEPTPVCTAGKRSDISKLDAWDVLLQVAILFCRSTPCFEHSQCIPVRSTGVYADSHCEIQGARDSLAASLTVLAPTGSYLLVRAAAGLWPRVPQSENPLAQQGRASLACALVRVRPLLRDEATHLHFGVRLPLPHLAAGYGSIMLADVRGVVDATAMSLQKPLHKLRLKRANAAHTILAASSGEKHSLWNASACKRRKVADARRRSESPMLHLSFVQRVRCPSTGFIATSPSVTGSCTQICEQNLAGLATACGVLVSNRIAERPHAVHS
ncbi:hypothetical protein AK812_SmicGene21996 [Symbiodinium microadriaticum]|uniref:Uncharacterized protein n=1 Tax=Symbiodinium microadriaticum TaxID=2951 RepID=A0A1Q9DKW3_SYMMI|nr:hypothetical protein AK812_SmicGene21996 [Symbiodinium microadriaticum]